MLKNVIFNIKKQQLKFLEVFKLTKNKNKEKKMNIQGPQSWNINKQNLNFGIKIETKNPPKHFADAINHMTERFAEVQPEELTLRCTPLKKVKGEIGRDFTLTVPTGDKGSLRRQKIHLYTVPYYNVGEIVQATRTIQTKFGV